MFSEKPTLFTKSGVSSRVHVPMTRVSEAAESQTRGNSTAPLFTAYQPFVPSSAFASTFVADSPESPVIGNAGNITFAGSGSTAVKGGATIASYSWDINGTTLSGNTVTWPSPINGGNFTVRLTVKDSVKSTCSVSYRMHITYKVCGKCDAGLERCVKHIVSCFHIASVFVNKRNVFKD